MKTDGSYRIYHIQHTNGKSEEHLIGRFLIKDNKFHILEDYDHILQDSFPEGFITDQHFKMLWSLSHSGYFKLIHENETNEGYHDNLIEDLDIGEVEPDAEYIIHEGNDQPKRLEMYGNSAIMDGQKLNDEELNFLMDKVHTGRVIKIPI